MCSPLLVGRIKMKQESKDTAEILAADWKYFVSKNRDVSLVPGETSLRMKNLNKDNKENKDDEERKASSRT